MQPKPRITHFTKKKAIFYRKKALSYKKKAAVYKNKYDKLKSEKEFDDENRSPASMENDTERLNTSGFLIKFGFDVDHSNSEVKLSNDEYDYEFEERKKESDEKFNLLYRFGFSESSSFLIGIGIATSSFKNSSHKQEYSTSFFSAGIYNSFEKVHVFGLFHYVFDIDHDLDTSDVNFSFENHYIIELGLVSPIFTSQVSTVAIGPSLIFTPNLTGKVKRKEDEYEKKIGEIKGQFLSIMFSLFFLF